MRGGEDVNCLPAKTEILIFPVSAPGVATSETTQALQAAAYPTIPYPGVGE